MNERTLYTLEFDKIREMLAEVSPTEGAAEKALRITPASDLEVAVKRQKYTTDAKRLMGHKGMPSFGRVRDVRSIADRADKGAVLTTRELMDTATVLKTARTLQGYISERDADCSLDELFKRLLPNKKLEAQINSTVIAEDMIADEASPELADIRRKIRNINAKIKDLLQKYVSGGINSKYLQENIVTQRSGRYVIPVKNEYRNEVKGLIHDTSSSGATLFIEPMSVVEANNELRELGSREKHEIDRILSELSAQVAAFGDELCLDYLNLTDLAFIFACAELSYKMDASEPHITEKRVITLHRARHPLLDTKSVVPINVSLGGEYDMLVVTGPNTGGKTVTLKTIGLFAIMAQAGLHIPADDDSTVCVFDEIFSDIGDEQSIEQSLSTFSSHMTEIIRIMNAMTDKSLVLFDELGSGTDPVEGAALAMAILEEVRSVGALCAATTHYAELKAYAIETDGVQNASCEFNVETLKPTYKLIIGAPGKSNAFAISEKLGLPENIVARAGRYIDSGSRSFEEVIEKLESERQKLEGERAEAVRLRREFEANKKEAEAELERRIGSAKAEAEAMQKKARQMVDSARASSDFILGQLDEVKKARQADDFAERLANTKRVVKSKLREAGDAVTDDTDEDNSDYKLPRPLKKGDSVVHRTMGTSGTLAEDPDKNGNVTVQMGVMKLRVSVDQLRLVEDDVKVKSGGKTKDVSTWSKSVSSTFKPELDVRGMIGDDAWFMVDKYLDDAAVAKIKSVTVIHGKGTGALRTAIWNHLKRDSRVKSYRAGQYGEGDFGVTVIELK